MVSTLVDNMIAATILVNNIMFGNVDAFKTSMQQAKRQCKGGIKNEYQCCRNIRTDIEMLRD
jgi:hypothetical protein